MLPPAGPLGALLAKARRRWLGLELVEQASAGLCLALAAAILLLLAGTQILDWYWPLALFLAACAFGLYRVFRRLPSPYRLAQLLDVRLALHDTLSTAVYFGAESARRAPEHFVRAQRRIAESASTALDLRKALPVRRPRSAWAAMGLALAVAILMLLRYGALGTLNLSAPIVTPDALFAHAEQRNAQKKTRPKAPHEKPFLLSLDQTPDGPKDLDAAGDSVLDYVDVPDVNNDDAVRGREKSSNLPPQAKPETEQSETGENEAGEEGSGEDSPQPDSSGRPNAHSPQQAGRQQPQNQENSSLMDKMRDALANLMAKLKIPPRAGEQGTQAGTRTERGESMSRERDPSAKQKGQAGQSQSNNANSDEVASADSEAQQAQAGQGQSSEKGNQQGDPSNNKSGMGSQDGEKAIREAEQLAAMGKISEIFGKRAQSVAGEIMVEVVSSKNQQLKTAYAERGGPHAEAGGQIARDEVPLQHQYYVQQYFEQLRKSGERSLPPGADNAVPPPVANGPQPTAR
jgi:hypothetical protein